VPDDIGEDCGNIVIGAADVAVLRSQKSACFPLVNTFVKLRVVKANRICLQPVANKVFGKGGNQGGVEATTEVASNGDIRSQADTRGIEQQGKQFFGQPLGAALRMLTVGGQFELPITLHS